MANRNRDARRAAEATAAANQAAAERAAQANRVNQITPWGNVTYSQTAPNQWQVEQTLSPQQQALFQQSQALQGNLLSGLNGLFGNQPNLQGLYNIDPSKLGPLQGINTSQLGSLKGVDTSKLGGLLGVDLSKVGNLAKWDTGGFNKLYNVNLGALPRNAINQGQTAQNAIMSRLTPQLRQQQQQASADLINQGFNPQDVGFQQGMQQQYQRGNDLMNQAALAGIDVDMRNRQNALAEQQARATTAQGNYAQQLAEMLGRTQYGINSYNTLLGGQKAVSEASARNYLAGLQGQTATSEAARQNYLAGLQGQTASAEQALRNYMARLGTEQALAGNALNNRNQQYSEYANNFGRYASLLSGLPGLVQSPGQYGVNVAQQQFTPGADYMQAMQMANAQRAGAQANRAGMLGGLGSMVGTLGQLGLTAYGMGLFSDRRLKKNIERIGTHKLGIGWYRFDYLWGEPGEGVMADELEVIYPEAVAVHPSGFKTVRYDMIG